MVWTGVDGEKVFSVEVSRLRREWRPTSRTGRRIYVIPSDLCLIRFRRTEIKGEGDLKKAMGLELEERFGPTLWDLKILNGECVVAVVKGFEPPRDAYSLDPEVFSLARCAKANGFENCTVVNVAKNRTTFVRVRDGRMKAYRVVLRGSDYIRKGNGLRDIVKDSGWDLSEEEVLLCGDLNGLETPEDIFGKVLRNRYTPPHLCSAFGASLRYVLPDEAPDFREEEVSRRELRRYILVNGLAFALMIMSAVLGDTLTDRIVDEIRRVQKETFKEAFPHLPASGIVDQLRAMVRRESVSMTELLSRIAPRLKEGMRVYRIEFSGSELRIVGEIKDRTALDPLKPQTVRRTPEGSYEFEVVVR